MPDSVSVIESPEMKKDFIYRNGLKTPKSATVLQVVLGFHLLLGLGLIGGSIALSVYQNSLISLTSTNLEGECTPQTMPYSTVRTVRIMQNWLNFIILKGGEWPTIRNGLPFLTKQEFITQHLSTLNSDNLILQNLTSLAESASFDALIDTDYGQSIYSIKVPTSSLNYTDYGDYVGTPNQRQFSIAELTATIATYISSIISDFPIGIIPLLNTSTALDPKISIMVTNSSIYMNPTSNYNFMFLWQNLDAITSSFNSFCENVIVGGTTTTNNIVNQLEYYIIIALTIYFAFTILLLSIIEYELKFKTRVLKLFEEQLGKDAIGKIYQKLSKKNDAQAILDTSFTTRFLGSKYILQFVVVLLGLIVGLSIGMINYETDGNATIALATFTDIELSFQVIEQVQRSAFLLDELFTYYGTNLQDIYSPHDGIKYGHPIFNTNDFDTLYQMVFNSTEILASSWNSLIYGNVNKLNARPIVGVYTAVDNIIQGPSNCSKYLNLENEL